MQQNPVERTLLQRLPHRISKTQAVRCLVALTNGDAKSGPKNLEETCSHAGVKADTARTVLEFAAEWDSRIVTAELAPGGEELRYSLTHDLFAPAVHSVNRRFGRKADARRRWLLASAATLAALLLTAALVSGWYSDRARRESDSRELASRAIQEPPGRRAYELTIKGFERAVTPEVIQAGRHLLTRPAPIAVVRLGLGADDLRLSRNGDRMATAYETGSNTWQSEVWHVNPPKKLGDIAGMVLDFHPSRDLVLVGSFGGLELIDTGSGKKTRIDTGDDEMQWVRFDLNGERVVGLTATIVAERPRIRRWDLTGHSLADSELPPEEERRIFAREMSQRRFTHDAATSNLEFLDFKYSKRLVAQEGLLSANTVNNKWNHQVLDDKVLDAVFEANDTVLWISKSGKLRRWYLEAGVDRYGVPDAYALPEATAAVFLPNNRVALKEKDGLQIFQVGSTVPLFRLPLGRAAISLDGTRVAIHSYEEKTVAAFDLRPAGEIGAYQMSATGLTPDGSSLMLEGPKWPDRSDVVRLPTGAAAQPPGKTGWALKSMAGDTLWESVEVALHGQNLRSGSTTYATPECDARQNVVSRSGLNALSLCKDGRLIMWQIAQRKTECVLSDHVSDFAWSGGADAVAVGLTDHSVRVLRTDCERNRGVTVLTA